MMNVSPVTASRGAWIALIAALLGWMFDGAEMGLFPLIGRPALQSLLSQPSIDKGALEAQVAGWMSVITAAFLIGAAAGGVVFGWLGDRIGRVRAMALSILTYAVLTGLGCLAQSPWQIAGLRFLAALGMGGEWSLGVALVMEIWPNRSRAFMAGLIGAAANVGYLIIAMAGVFILQRVDAFGEWLVAQGISDERAAWWVGGRGWRLMMALGAAPALLTFFIRAAAPESPAWLAKQSLGGKWSSKDLIGVGIGLLGAGLALVFWIEPVVRSLPEVMKSGFAIGALRIGGTLIGLALAAGGFLYPVYAFMLRRRADGGKQLTNPLPRMILAACLSGTPLLGTWASVQWAPTWADQLVEKAAQTQESPSATSRPPAKEWTQMASASGAILGTLLAAWLGGWLGRRVTYCLLCVASMLAVCWLFLFHTEFGAAFLLAVFLAGASTASFYGWLPLYLPELFASEVRATGQGFGFNFGRILSAIGVMQTGALMSVFADGATLGPLKIPGGYPFACSAMSLIYFVGLGVIWLAPETKDQPLPD